MLLHSRVSLLARLQEHAASTINQVLGGVIMLIITNVKVKYYDHQTVVYQQ